MVACDRHPGSYSLSLGEDLRGVQPQGRYLGSGLPGITGMRGFGSGMQYT